MIYYERQYFHPLLYFGLVGFAVVCIALVFIQAAVQALSLFTVLEAGLFLLVVLSILALGRMVVKVDDGALVVSFGWLGLMRRSFELNKIEDAKICVFRPLAACWAWGLRIRMYGSVCYATRGGQGVEITIGGRRYLIGSGNPAALKAAVLECQDEINEQLEFRRERFSVLAPRPRPIARQSWGIVRPDEIRRLTSSPFSHAKPPW